MTKFLEMKGSKIFIAQAMNRGEWFDLTYPTTLENARWFINDEVYARHSKKIRSKAWTAFRLKLAK